MRDANASGLKKGDEKPVYQTDTIVEEVPEPRVRCTVDHDLSDVRTIALCTILCDGDSLYDLEDFRQVRLPWLKTFLPLRNGAPEHDTYNRVFQVLDPEKFGDCLGHWTQSVLAVLGGEVSPWTARPCAAR